MPTLPSSRSSLWSEVATSKDERIVSRPFSIWYLAEPAKTVCLPTGTGQHIFIISLTTVTQKEFHMVAVLLQLFMGQIWSLLVSVENVSVLSVSFGTALCTWVRPRKRYMWSVIFDVVSKDIIAHHSYNPAICSSALTSPVVVVRSLKQFVGIYHGWCSLLQFLTSAFLHLCLLLSKTWDKCCIQSFSQTGRVPIHCLCLSLYCRDE